MKKSSIFLIVMALMLILVGYSAPEQKAQKVVENYFEEIYIATPLTMEEELWTFFNDNCMVEWI